jgi:hypothetical protein
MHCSKPSMICAVGDPDFTSVHLDGAFRYGEPQAGATHLAGDRIVGVLKLLEQHGLISRRNARAWAMNGAVE